MSGDTGDTTGDERVKPELVWPAPGLERMHGMLNNVRARAALSAVLIGGPFAWVLAGLPTYDTYVRATIGWIVAIALFIFLTSILRLAGIVDMARKARRLGYTRAVILETVADKSRDTLFLISGTGSYINVLERTRDRVRRLRLWSAFFSTTAAIVPLPLLCIALMLGMRGDADAIGFALLVFAPVMGLMISAALTSGYASILTQWDRGGDAWDPSPITESDRAAEWRATAHQPDARATRGGLFTTLLTAAGGIILFASVAFIIAVTLVYALVIRDQYARSLYMGGTIGAGEGTVNIEIMRDNRLPVDSAAPIELARTKAGEALQSLIESVRLPRALPQSASWKKKPVRTYTASLWPLNLNDNWAGDYFSYVAHGRPATHKPLPPAYLAYDSIAHAPAHPALQELNELATARDIDVTSTRFVLPLNETSVMHMADFSFGQRAVDAAVLINAASRMEHHDAAGAELMLRRLLSAGFLLMDNSPFSGDMWTGSMWVSAARRGLIALYGATGRTADSVALVRPYQANMRGYAKSGGTGSPGSMYVGRLSSSSDGRLNALLGLVHNREVFPAMRWEALASAVPLAKCGSMRSAMFGVDDYTDLRINNARADVIRIPSDSVLANALFNRKGAIPFTLSSRVGFRRLQQAVLGVIGPHQFESACAGAFSPRF